MNRKIPKPCKSEPRASASAWLRAVVAILIPSTVLAGQHTLVAQPPINADLSGYSPNCGVAIEQIGDSLHIRWPMAEQEAGLVSLNLQPGGPLMNGVAIAETATHPPMPLLRGIDPVTYVTVGTRRTPEAKPPDQRWAVFFDKPANRPHQTYASELSLKSARVTSRGRRATIALSELTAGPFRGELHITIYTGSRLVQLEAVLQTEEDGRAIIYDAGLLFDHADQSGVRNMAWMDTEGRLQRTALHGQDANRALAVRHRTIVAESDHGSVACFSPPHQFHFPRDWTDNFRYVWFGRNHRGLGQSFGFGVRQDKAGGRAFVPWFNAPPGVKHRMGVFLLLTSGDAENALSETLRYTHGDRFPKLPGYLTMTSHWHMAIAVAAMQQRAAGIDPLPIPEFVDMFKNMGVNMVHLGEFHGDGHQKDPGPLRLPELEAMFAECRRLSDDELLLIPGEEVNTFLGLPQPGKHPGHWMSLFPKPIYWTMQREADQPFVEEHSDYGKLYRVGSREDMMRLLEAEHGLAWSAHPRIKASSWTPDIFRHEDFYLADYWLGGAWKALPADLSQDRLGWRPLELLSDMANWGQKKYLLGEVDVFKLDHTHELYGHININYVRLEHLPQFGDGWQPLLDALRAGQFFVSTGEVLIPEFTVGGKRSGETLLARGDGRTELRAQLEWTFPLQFAEIISGDGQTVYRQRLDLSWTGSFGRHVLSVPVPLQDRAWVRLEVWDAATNGAFTQPVWLSSSTARTAVNQ